jgi:hypothetical protein
MPAFDKVFATLIKDIKEKDEDGLAGTYKNRTIKKGNYDRKTNG